MPLIKSASKEAVSKNIAQLLKDGKPRKQAIAIALSIQQRAKKKHESQYVSVASLFEGTSFGSPPHGFDFSRIPIGDAHGLSTSPSGSTTARPEDQRDFPRGKVEPTQDTAPKAKKKRGGRRGRRVR